MSEKPNPRGNATIACVVGARPNFVKVAPILRAFAAHRPRIEATLVHTGQHHDASMSDQHFTALRLPSPDINLGVHGGNAVEQIAQIMQRFDAELEKLIPAAVLVVGDVNSTLACALTAVKRGIPVIHVEAGLRSFDRAMPEEINRVLTDQLSDVLFTTEASALENLQREGIDSSRVHFVGNVMIDSVFDALDHAIPVASVLAAATPRDMLESRVDLQRGYAVLTLHRPSNVDDPAMLRALLEGVAKIAARLPVLFPVHPRTAAMIARFELTHLLDTPGLVGLPPVGYLEMLGLLKDARLVITDSGGLQEETTALGVPCLTLRDNTERPITIEHGTNILAGTNVERLGGLVEEVLDGKGKSARVPDLWDGHAAERIAAIVNNWLGERLQRRLQ